jgi:hypothetical protein
LPSAAPLPLHSSSRRRTWERRVAVLAASVSLALHAALLLGIRYPIPTPEAPIDLPGLTPVLRAVAIKSEAVSLLPAPSVAATSNAILANGVATEREPLEERTESIPSADEAERQSTATTSSTTPPADRSSALFWRGYRDSRLSIAPLAPKPSDGQSSARIALDARFRAVRDSLEAEMRSLPNTLARGYYPGGTVKIMPEDGRIWELSQLLRQNQAFVRDSIGQERIRAIRERKNAERNGNQKP